MSVKPEEAQVAVIKRSPGDSFSCLISQFILVAGLPSDGAGSTAAQRGQGKPAAQNRHAPRDRGRGGDATGDGERARRDRAIRVNPKNLPSNPVELLNSKPGLSADATPLHRSQVACRLCPQSNQSMRVVLEPASIPLPAFPLADDTYGNLNCLSDSRRCHRLGTRGDGC